MATAGKLKTITIADQRIVVRPDQLPPVYLDVINEARQFSGTIYLSLGALIHDTTADPEVEVLVRARMDIIMAQALHGLLGQMIKDALKPADTSKAS